MKKLLYLVLFSLILVSCSNDESDVEPDPYILDTIIGSWAYDTVTINSETFLYQHTDGCVKDLFQFYNEDGKEFDFEEDYVSNCSNCAECAITSTNLRWDLNGNSIDLYFGEQLITQLEILDVNENIIEYKRIFDFDNDGLDDEVIITGIPYDPYGEFD